MGALPQLGQDVAGEIGGLSRPNEWIVSVDGLPSGWTARLRSRWGRLYEPGEHASCWVYGIDSSQSILLLGDSDFGRLPISDRMRPRYVRALRAGLSLTRGLTNTYSADDLSELKGLLNRCVRKDQWDWLTIYRALGQPEPAVLRRLSQWVAEMAAASRRSGEPGKPVGAARLRNPEFASIFQMGLAVVTTSAPRLESRTVVPPQVLSNDVERVQDLTGADPYIISRTAKVKIERANATHSAVQGSLVNFLEGHGFVVEQDRLIDVFARLRTGPAIFEVKSITARNERAQCRHALSQLYEYRYLYSVPEASLWLVLSRPLQASWLADYLESDRGVGVLWHENQSFHGLRVAELA